jgi:cell division protein FtsW
MSTRRKAGLWSGLDRPILVIVIFLMAIGIVLAFAASPAAAERAAWIDDPFYYLYRQLVLSRAWGSPYWRSSPRCR